MKHGGVVSVLIVKFKRGPIRAEQRPILPGDPARRAAPLSPVPMSTWLSHCELCKIYCVHESTWFWEIDLPQNNVDIYLGLKMIKCKKIQMTLFCWDKWKRWLFQSFPLWNAWRRLQPEETTSSPLVWKQRGCKHSTRFFKESFKLHVRMEMVRECSLQLAEYKERAKLFKFQAHGRILSQNQVPVLLAQLLFILSEADNAFLALRVSKITFTVKINSCNTVFGWE